MKDARVKFGCRLAGDNGNLGPLDSLLPPHPTSSHHYRYCSIVALHLDWARHNIKALFFLLPSPHTLSLNTPHASTCHTPYICYAGSIMGQGPTEPSCEVAYHAPRSRDALQVLMKKEAWHSILGEANPCYQPHKFLKRWPVAWSFLTTTEAFLEGKYWRWSLWRLPQQCW